MTDASYRVPHTRRRKSRKARVSWTAALAASSALVAAGIVGAYHPAGQDSQTGQTSRLDAYGTADTAFGAAVTASAGAAKLTGEFGDLPVIGSAHYGVPSPKVWKSSAVTASKYAVVMSFTASPAAILSGADNRALTQFFDAAPTGRTIYYSYDSEPEAAVTAHKFTAFEYRRAWARVATIASKAKNPDLKSTLVLSASDAAAGSAQNWQSYLPGGSVISTLAWDAYPKGTLSGQDPRLTPPAVFMGAAVAAAKKAGLPFGVAGFAQAKVQGRAAWLKSVAEYLKGNGALFGLVTTVPSVPTTQLTDQASVTAWRKVVASSGTGQPAPTGSAPVTTPTIAPTTAPVTTPTTAPTTAPVTSAPTTPAPAPSSSSSSSGTVCSTSAAQGSCGPYADSEITGVTSNTSVGNDVWSPITGWQQTLNVTNPSDWNVTANMPAGNTAVVSYPSLGANFGQVTNNGTPLSDYKSIYSSFSENMNATSQTSAWAAYDIWLGDGTASQATHEVMIQHDFSNNGACTAEATATFGGSGGVPVQTWNLCQFGSELVWKLTGGNEQSGSVDVLGMLNWLVTNGYLPSDAALFSVGYGWEICSTGGQNENFQLSNFSIAATQ